MANPHKGDVGFKIDGKTYTLRYSINAICVMEELTGMSLIELSEVMQNFKSVRMSMVRNIFYAGLVDHHPGITVEEAGDLILAAGGTLAVMTKYNEAMAAAYPKPEASGTPRPPRRERRRAASAKK